jgi:hypothetical protein
MGTTPLKPIAPVQSKQQHVGRLGEAAVAAFFTEAGWIVHPPLSGGDFGIDARVEIVDEASEVTGLEFFVQIKATGRSVADDEPRVNLGKCPVGTLEYWYAKPAPTLLVLYSSEMRAFFWGWLPEVVPPDRLVDAVRNRKRVLNLSMKRRILARGDLPEIHRVVHQAAINRGAESVRAVMRKDLLFLYRVASNCLDLLTEWMASRALPDSPSSTVPPQPTPGSVTEERLQQLDPLTRLTLPVVLLYQSLQLCLRIAENPVVDAENAGIWNTRKLVRVIEALYMGLYTSMGEDLQKLARANLEGSLGREKVVFLRVPPEVGERNLALLALAIRDYLAVMREGAFPKLFGPEPANPVSDLAAIHEAGTSLWLSHLPAGEERDRLSEVFKRSGERDA